MLEKLEGRTFYAVGGTWRALAKLQMAERGYPLRVLHGYTLDAGEGLAKLVERAIGIAKSDADISSDRRPLLVYGAVVLDEIVRLGRPRDIVVSALGVREGLLSRSWIPRRARATRSSRPPPSSTRCAHAPRATATR